MAGMAEMSKGPPLGLDELMIVNPSELGAEAFFLGQDGILYQVQGVGQQDMAGNEGEFFLGEDGALYQVEASGLRGSIAGSDESTGCSCKSAKKVGGTEGGTLGRFFLGENGTMYELVR